MKINGFSMGGAFSLALAAALVSGCGAGDFEQYAAEQEGEAYEEGEYSEEDSEELELGTLEQGLQNCSNPDGTNSVMAAFAVAVAQELKRWQAGTDFIIYNTSAAYENAAGSQQAIKLQSGTGPDGKPRGKSRCSDGACKKTQALLAMQYENARNQVWVQGENSTNKVLVDPAALRSRMVAKLYEQKACDTNAKDGDPNACPKETHLLSFAGTASLGGCGQHFKFSTSKDPTGSLAYRGQLKHKLKFADAANGWVDFRDLGNGQVAIDPTYGLNEGATSTAGSCEAACTKVSPSANLTGQCCSCSGIAKKWAASTFSASVFLCK